jgi:hypothetical protein
VDRSPPPSSEHASGEQVRGQAPNDGHDLHSAAGVQNGWVLTGELLYILRPLAYRKSPSPTSAPPGARAHTLTSSCEAHLACCMMWRPSGGNVRVGRTLVASLGLLASRGCRGVGLFVQWVPIRITRAFSSHHPGALSHPPLRWLYSRLTH